MMVTLTFMAVSQMHMTDAHMDSCTELIVCVEVLQPSQPNGVISSTVSLPNHTFTGQT